MGQPKRSERGYNPAHCPLTAAMTVMGSKWAGVVWYRLSQGPLRSAELRRSIPGISQKMLVEQLRHFEAQGIVARTVHDTVPPQIEYALTSYGQTLTPVYDAICDWGARHLKRQQDTDAESLPSSLT